MPLADSLQKFLSTQKAPPVKKKPIIAIRSTYSEAFKAFLVQYQRLTQAKLYSGTAHMLYRSCLRAETCKDLIGRLEKHLRTSQSILDLLSGLQLLIFGASNWVRRFCDDRNQFNDYILAQEKKEGRSIAETIDESVKNIFTKVAAESNSQTLTMAFQAFETKWRQEDKDTLKVIEQQNARTVEILRKAWQKAEHEDMSKISEERKYKFMATVEELEDSRAPLTTQQKIVVNSVKTWMLGTPDHIEETELPKWRAAGIKTLGPFGIAAKLDLELEISWASPDFTIDRATGTYTAKGPEAVVNRYAASLDGVVKGPLSPIFPITIKRSDPSASLIRIPLNAKYFAFAYPVISGDLEVQVDTYTPNDAFLLYGGFLYFDADAKLIQVNGLWVGNNLLLSAPKKLPMTVEESLESQGRFHDITLPQLSAAGAKKFAFILPNEFPEIRCAHGGWCYKYDDIEINNYFAIASAESVKGVGKAFVMRPQ